MSSHLKLLARLRSGSIDAAQLCPHCCSDNAAGRHLSPLQQQAPASHGTLDLHSRLVRQKMRRASFIPEQKLEELRDLRIQLDKDKQEWQTKFDRMQEQLLNERRELDLAREQLRQDRQQVANEREQLYRKLDLLKEKGILLSPSHKVIITTPDLRVMQQQQQQPQHHYGPYYQSQMYGQLMQQPPTPQQQQQMLLVSEPASNSNAGTSTVRIGHSPFGNQKQAAVNVMQHQQTKQTNRVPLHLSQQQQNTSGSSQLASVAGKIAASIPFIGNHV